MLTFPGINARVTDSDRIDGEILTVVAIDYATGMVTLELVTDSATAPRGKRPVNGVLTYRQDMSRLTRVCEWCGNRNMETEANPNVPELCLACAPEA